MKLKDSDLPEDIYTLPSFLKVKTISLLCLIFIISFFMSFPLYMIVTQKFKNSILQSVRCNFSYSEIQTEFFMPKVIIQDLVVPGSCFNSYQNNLNFKKVKLSFSGFSFYPFGPLFRLKTDFYNNPLDVNIGAGLGGIIFKIDENKINLASLKLIRLPISFMGNITTNGHVMFNSKGQLKSLDLDLHSKDLILPKQTIQMFELKTQSIKNLHLKAQLQESKLNILKGVIGTDSSDIRANLKGHISLNDKNIKSSKLSIKSEVAFSEKFLTDYSIIKLFLGKFNRVDNFYQINISGPLGYPQLKQ